MGQLEDMQLFIRVVDAGGISRAAEQLGIAKSAVSRRLGELESRLGSKLMQRTTRRSHLTESGRRYYDDAVKAVDFVAQVNAGVSDEQAELSGVLRVAVPLSFGLLHLSPAIDLFHRQYPQVDIQVDFSDRQVDLVEDGFDLAIRIANLQDSSIQARRIAQVRLLMLASPGYASEYGLPKSLEELPQHRILAYGSSNNTSWTVRDPEGIEHSMRLRGALAANNGDFLQKMALAGHGIAILPSFIAWQALLAGELIPVLPDCAIDDLQAWAVYSQSRFLPQKARRFIDFMVERFGDNPYWDQF